MAKADLKKRRNLGFCLEYYLANKCLLSTKKRPSLFFVKLDVKHAMGINFQLEHSHVSKVNKRRTFRDVKIHVRRSTAVILEHAINLSKKGCMVWYYKVLTSYHAAFEFTSISYFWHPWLIYGPIFKRTEKFSRWFIFKTFPTKSYSPCGTLMYQS